MSNTVSGKVVEIDDDGNLVTDLTAEQLAEARELADKVRLDCGGYETFGIYSVSDEFPPSTFAAQIRDDNRLQFTLTGARASDLPELGEGAEVTVSW